jgi:hypothetical protein
MTPQNHAGKRLEWGGVSRAARVHCASTRAIAHDDRQSAQARTQERPSRNGAGVNSLLGAGKSNRVDGDFNHALE